MKSKIISGTSHDVKMTEGIYSVGTSQLLDLQYNTEPCEWLPPGVGVFIKDENGNYKVKWIPYS